MERGEKGGRKGREMGRERRRGGVRRREGEMGGRGAGNCASNAVNIVLGKVHKAAALEKGTAACFWQTKLCHCSWMYLRMV